MELQWDMVILLDLQPMYVSAIANQGLHKFKGWFPKWDFGCKNKKSAGYSHESTQMIMSSKISLVK